MRLLARTNVYFFLITVVVLSLGSEVFFQRMRAINRADADERLHHEKEQVIRYINANNVLPQNAIFLGDSVSFSPANGTVDERIGHKRLYNQEEEEYEVYHTLTFQVSINNKPYEAVIYRPLLEADDITTAIAESIAILAVCLLIVLLLSNYIISKILWRPFYGTLEKVKSFDVTKESKIEFSKTNIEEFGELNNVLIGMTRKIASDYNTLKEFTENASHEIQTPLAIILSKLELMMQPENLSAKQMEQIQAIYESAGRLSKLNQALLLLAKIENRQFSETENVYVNELIEQKLNMFEELLKHKNISVEKDMTTVQLQMHPALADILIGNLIGNAIKHNTDPGKLCINLTEKQLLVENSGDELTVNPNQFFERFSKHNAASESLGLGLAIVKEICNLYGIEVTYTYTANLHSIALKWN